MNHAMTKSEVEDARLFFKAEDGRLNCARHPRTGESKGLALLGEIDRLRNLIIAAPDLLAACKALIDAPHQEHFAVRMNDSEMAAIELMRAAIVKAEGEAPIPPDEKECHPFDLVGYTRPIDALKGLYDAVDEAAVFEDPGEPELYAARIIAQEVLNKQYKPTHAEQKAEADAQARRDSGAEA